jgi:hypothetical protein
VPRGKVIDELAGKRNVRGPYNIAKRMKSRFPDAPSGVSVAKWMYGDATPRPESLQVFAQAFDLDEHEKMRLALAHTYNKTPGT